MSDADDRLVEEIYDALDRGEPEEALLRARTALRDVGEDPVLRFLSGVALMEMDRPAEAVPDFEKAVEGDPDDPEFRTNLAMAQFHALEFEDAAENARLAAEADPGYPDAQFVRALTLEREGKYDEADQCLRNAHRLDPENHPRPRRFTRVQFEEEVRPALDPELLGLFTGTALPDRRFDGPTAGDPPRILLFQRNLERYSGGNEDNLVDEVRRTLYHELAHYLGFDEEQMAGLDLD